MIILNAGQDGANVKLTKDELMMLNNALNEVCNGVHELGDDGEFQTRLAWERANFRRLLSEINSLL